MEFLYSLNRLNFETSRAQALVIVVGSPCLLEPAFRERIAGLQTGLRVLSKRSMRVFGAVLSVCLAFGSCKKNPQLVAPAAQQVAKATPAPPATSVPESVNLKSQVIVLCYHRFEDKPGTALL